MIGLSDQNGTPLCPVRHVSWDYDDVDEKTARATVCGEEVNLIVSLLLSVGPGEVVPMKDVGEWANTSSWKVECARGHVLAISDAEENPEDFSWEHLFGWWER